MDIKVEMMRLEEVQDIDEVISSLEDFINDCIKNENRMGYFACLYCSVTKEVKKGIQENRFEDGPRMAILDVHFANMFFSATRETSDVWKTAFDAATRSEYVLLQHLLLGMNTHINYDLALAVKKSMNKEEMNDIYKDYNEINLILIEQIDLMQEGVNKSWWVYRLLDILALRFDELIIGFSLVKARQSAWEFAQGLQDKTIEDITKDEMKELTLSYADILVNPKGFIVNAFRMINYLFEQKTVSKLIQKIRS